MTWTIIGDGQWGEALARRLAKQATVTLVGEKASKRKVPRKVPAAISLSTDAGKALRGSERVVLAVPVDRVEAALLKLAPHLRGDHRVVTTARGLTPDAHWRASEAVYRLTAVRQLAVLAGAAHAKALNSDQHAALVVGSPFTVWGAEIQDALASPTLRVYTNADAVGVELANALATVFAVVLATAQAMGVGPATVATAQTRALAEMDRLVQGLGGAPNTAYGLAGLGVLATLLYDATDEVHDIGRQLAADKSVKSFKELREVARTMAARAAQARLRAPLLEAVDALMAGRVKAREALVALMERAVRAE